MNQEKDGEGFAIKQEGDGLGQKREQGQAKLAKEQEDNDFPLGKACDLSGEGTCDSCQ